MLVGSAREVFTNQVRSANRKGWGGWKGIHLEKRKRVGNGGKEGRNGKPLSTLDGFSYGRIAERRIGSP